MRFRCPRCRRHGTSTRFAADIVASGARRSGEARNAADQTVASGARWSSAVVVAVVGKSRIRSRVRARVRRDEEDRSQRPMRARSLAGLGHGVSGYPTTPRTSLAAALDCRPDCEPERCDSGRRRDQCGWRREGPPALAIRRSTIAVAIFMRRDSRRHRRRRRRRRRHHRWRCRRRRRRRARTAVVAVLAVAPASPTVRFEPAAARAAAAAGPGVLGGAVHERDVAIAVVVSIVACCLFTCCFVVVPPPALPVCRRRQARARRDTRQWAARAAAGAAGADLGLPRALEGARARGRAVARGGGEPVEVAAQARRQRGGGLTVDLPSPVARSGAIDYGRRRAWRWTGSRARRSSRRSA